MSRGLLKTKLLAKSSNNVPAVASYYQLTTVANLQDLASKGAMVAGTTYQITDITPNWQGVFMADSGTKLSVQGQGIYQNTLFTEAYYNLQTNTLLKIYDPVYNNEIEGSTNINNFTWNNAAFKNNKILGESTITTLSVTNFNNNVIMSSQVDLDNIAVTTFEYNTIVNKSNVTVNPGTTGYVYKNNYISNSTITLSGQCQLDSCTIKNISANIAESHTKELVDSTTSSSFSVTLNFTANYNAGTNTLTIPIAYKDYVGIFNFTNIDAGAGIIKQVNTIVNPPTLWNYFIYNKSNNTDVIKLTKNAGNLKFHQGVAGANIDLIDIFEYAEFKDYSNTQYLIIHNDY